jgi:hypothetical protein
VHKKTVPRIVPNLPRQPITETKVTREPRDEKIRLPVHLRGYKPGAEPNSKYIDLESPIHRQLHTSSMSHQTGRFCIFNREFTPETTLTIPSSVQLMPGALMYGILRDGKYL